MHILTGNYLFNLPTGTPSPWFGVLTAGFAVLFLASALAYWRRAKLAPENPVQRRFIRRAAQAGMWSAGIGLFLALMRYLQVDYLDIPFWLLLLFIGMILAVAFFIYDLSERYPVAVWHLQESTLQRRYRPAAKLRPEPQRIRPKVRGKRRR
ncbi:MAG TPA: hypothetical protein VF221_01275 [Chloroflexota bacterium]